MTEDAAGGESIRVLFFNSWQASMLPDLEEGEKRGGYEHLSAMIDSRKGNATFICTNGDFLPGDVDDRRPAIEALNTLGVQAVAIGNLELNYGAKALRKKLEEAKFSVVNANIHEKDAPLFPPYRIEKSGKFSLAVIGVISGEAAVKAKKEVLGELRFRDPIKEVEKAIQEIPPGIPIIVLSDLARNEEIELARSFPRIQLIIGRYDLDPEQRFVKVGPVSLVHLRKKRGSELGEIELENTGGVWKCTPLQVHQIGPDTRDCRNLPVNQPARKLIAAWQDRERQLREILGSAQTFMEGSSPAVRQHETNLGNLLADILLESAPQADMAVINSGFIRASIPEGAVDRGTLQTVLPFKNNAVELMVPGEVIVEMLENAVARYGSISGAFLQVGGISFSFSPERPAFSRIIDVKIQGKPLERDRIYRMATLSYLASGGDDYTMLRDIKPVSVSQGDFQEMVEAYLQRKKTLKSALEGRIRIVKTGP